MLQSISWFVFNLFGQPMWYLRLLNRLGIRKDSMTCIRQDETWCWPDHLGEQTAGLCSKCNSPIYFEKQNWVFYKVCTRC